MEGGLSSRTSLFFASFTRHHGRNEARRHRAPKNPRRGRLITLNTHFLAISRTPVSCHDAPERTACAQGLSHAVVDKTGLTDLYDITLRWSPDDIGSSDASLPSLFSALQEQLGLKLEYDKHPIDVIVIDRIDRPSEN